MPLFYFLLGAIMAIIALVGFYNPALKAGMHENTVALISYLKYSILIVFPLIYAMLGFVLGVVAAFFYNIFSKLTGGIKIDLD